MRWTPSTTRRPTPWSCSTHSCPRARRRSSSRTSTATSRGFSSPVSILLTAPERERSAPFLRERYDASDRIPDSVEAYPVEERTAYVIRPHRALVVDARDRALVIEDVPVELVLALS